MILPPLVGSKSQAGARGGENDDHCAAFTLWHKARQLPMALAAVADGVTATTGGAQASRIALETLQTLLPEQTSTLTTLSEWLAAAIEQANDEILFSARRNPQWKGMSSTLVLAALAGDRLYVQHLGDSRAYLIRGGVCWQLTVDHTWAQVALHAGVITEAEAAQHPGRNQLQRYLGNTPGHPVDRGVIAPESGQLEEYLHVQPGDAILLCSDGLYRRLDTETLAAVVGAHPNQPQLAVEALIAAAVARGERDDITAVLWLIPA